MARRSTLSRGDIWWARLPPPDKTRPVMLVSRDEALRTRRVFIVAPITRRVRGIAAEVPVGRTEGLLVESVANCDSLQAIRRSLLIERVGQLAPSKIDALDAALKFALGLE